MTSLDPRYEEPVIIDSRWETETLPGLGRFFLYGLHARTPGVSPEWSLQTVYIGSTQNLRARIRAHSKKWWFRALDPSLAEFIEYPTLEDARDAERKYIQRENPPMNTMLRSDRDDLAVRWALVRRS